MSSYIFMVNALRRLPSHKWQLEVVADPATRQLPGRIRRSVRRSSGPFAEGRHLSGVDVAEAPVRHLGRLHQLGVRTVRHINESDIIVLAIYAGQDLDLT